MMPILRPRIREKEIIGIHQLPWHQPTDCIIPLHPQQTHIFTTRPLTLPPTPIHPNQLTLNTQKINLRKPTRTCQQKSTLPRTDIHLKRTLPHRKKRTKITRPHPALRKNTDCRLFFASHNVHTFLRNRYKGKENRWESQTETICASRHPNPASQRSLGSNGPKTNPTGMLVSASGSGACSNNDKNQSLPLDATLSSH